MIAFRGRLKYITKLSNKPISEGYKVWALVEYGYIWSWLWYLMEEGTEYTFFVFDERVSKDLDLIKQMIV